MSARSRVSSRLPNLVSRWGLAVGLALLPLSAPQLFLAEAQAFCGFFVTGADAAVTNNASQVALLRKGNRTVLTMSNNYKGPPEDFAMVVPVPVVLKKEDVKTLAADVFTHIDQLSAPRLVEYWEQDPCRPPYPDAEDDVATERKSGEYTKKKDGGAARLGVKIEAKFEVGEYQILILSAKESTGLETWLRQSKYKIPSGAAAALAPYVRDQQKFFVAKVDITKVKRDTHGYVILSPLRVAYDSTELRLPVRLGLLNAESKQDLIIYILHPQQRFEVANYRNVFIPTNLEVNNSVRKMFPAFYAELFDETLRRNNNRAVVTEYAWQTSSCDPCPTPPLEASDLYTLGDDSFAGAPAGEGRGKNGPYYGSPPQYVLTRLHTRYDKQTLSEDLIFRTADPVVGGRSDGDGTLGDPTPRLTKQGSNNFQSRYIIRHYWEGKVACQSPSYGVWGGPPSGEQDGRVKAAADLANVPRGAVKLPQVVESAVPMLGLAAKEKRPLRPGETRPKP